MVFGAPFPTPVDLISNEVETVRFLSENTHVGEYPDFINAARRSYAQFIDGSKRFEFASSLEVFHKGLPGGPKIWKSSRPSEPPANCRLVLAALIETEDDGTFGNVSYVLAVCRVYPGSTRSSILRKFHFDFAPKAFNTDRQPHPVFHVQYCGELFDGMATMGYRPEQLNQLHTKVREPRILFTPMTLALLIDMSIREFSNPTLIKLRDSPEWKNIVRKNELDVLKPFYEECVRVITSNEKKRTLLAESFYLR